MAEKAIPMDEPKEKLRNLENHMPDAQDFTHQFGSFLAEYLNPSLVPKGFVLGCELALYDLQNGINGFTSQPLRNELVGQPPIVFSALRLEIPHIAAAVFPEDFAEAVRAYHEKVMETMKAT